MGLTERHLSVLNTGGYLLGRLKRSAQLQANSSGIALTFRYISVAHFLCHGPNFQSHSLFGIVLRS
jgi:hypothetical protein